MQESWKESIIAIAAFTELPLNEQKREANKATLYCKTEATRYRCIIKCLMKPENRTLDYRYENGNGPRRSRQRINRRLHGTDTGTEIEYYSVV